MTTTLLEAARGLYSRIDERAAGAKGEPVPNETIRALQDADLFGAMCPKAVGGAELSIGETLDVFEEVARADGSAGWCLMASASTAAYFGAYAPDSFVEKLFANGVPLAAGQFAPNGIAVRDGDGYRVSGNYQFGSGIAYADWVGGGILTQEPEGSDKPSQFLMCLLPKDQVTLKGNWDVLGLQSTASYDYAIDNVWVAEEAMFLFAAPTVRRGNRLYELGVIALTAAGHAGFAFGVVRRALDELMEIAQSKVRMGSSVFMKESERFLESLGILESRFRAGRSWCHETFANAEAGIHKTGVIDPAAQVELRQATVFVTQEGADIVRQAYLLAGTTGLRSGALQRCFRDIHAGSQHFFASPASTLDFAKNLMTSAAE